MKRNRLSLSTAVVFALLAASPANAQCTHQPVPSSIPASFKFSVTLNDGTGGVALAMDGLGPADTWVPYCALAAHNGNWLGIDSAFKVTERNGALFLTYTLKRVWVEPTGTDTAVADSRPRLELVEEHELRIPEGGAITRQLPTLSADITVERVATSGA